jgi:hypothetical protein
VHSRCGEAVRFDVLRLPSARTSRWHGRVPLGLSRALGGGTTRCGATTLGCFEFVLRIEVEGYGLPAQV